MSVTSTCFAGIDIGKYKSSIAVIGAKGKCLREATVITSVKNFIDFFSEAKRRPNLIGFESGTIGRALCLGLREHGYHAIVIDARQAAPILREFKRQKTDRNDAVAIAELLRIGGYRETWLRSVESRDKLLRLQARNLLVRTETTFKNALSAHLTARGNPVKFGARRTYLNVFDELFDNGHLDNELRILYDTLKSVSTKIKELDAAIESSVRNSPICPRLMTMPGVGPLTAAWFEAVIDRPERFKRSRDVGAYLGLVPRVRQSGSIRKMGRITKSGSGELRRNMYLAAKATLYSTRRKTRMKSWAARLLKKKGGNVAIIALARRMAVVLHTMWRSGEEFKDDGKTPKNT